MPPVPKIESVQILRALAAGGVVWFHAAALLGTPPGTTLDWSQLGSAGVDLFFVVSGFIMWVTAIDRDASIKQFAIKRIVRIVPLYWLITSVVLAICTIKPELVHNASRDFKHFAASYAFVAWPHPTQPGRLWPPVVPGWTLNYEALFYLIVAASLALRKRWRGPFCAAVLVGLSQCGVLLHPTDRLAFYTNPILLEFLMGLAVGATYKSIPFPAISWGLIVVGLTLFLCVGRLGTDDNRVLTWGLPLAMVTLGAVNWPLPGRAPVVRWLTALGDASYSIYLTQFLALPPAAKLLAHLIGDSTTALKSALCVLTLIAIALSVGLATYRLIEIPLTRAAKRILTRAAHVGILPTGGTGSPAKGAG
jgi:exopolysaccharide production protein ExoZ